VGVLDVIAENALRLLRRAMMLVMKMKSRFKGDYPPTLHIGVWK
jgi:hypothetical protein